MKILYVTTVGLVMQFFRSYIKELLAEGHAVEIATNETDLKVPECYREWGCKIHPISTTRSPMDRANLDAIKQIRTLVIENQYDIVHCHTPIAAACTRLACRKLRKKGVKVVYTAHGFHFYTGAPLKNWLCYYPIEKLCARWTDTLVTINREDYDRAKMKMRTARVEYVPGVGFDVNYFAKMQVDRASIRRALGVPDEAFMLFSVGELNENKNHELILRAIPHLARKDVHYVVAGQGGRKDYLLALARELGIEERVHLPGFRTDVAQLYKAADLFVFPSFREGLPVSVMEAMAAGLAIVCTDIRGNRDLICDGEGGYFIDPRDVISAAARIEQLMSDDALRQTMAAHNTEAAQCYSVVDINARMREIYRAVTGEGAMS